MTDKYQPALHDAVEHDADAEGGERVAKALARAGVASRREVERLIEAGKVVLNGQVLATPAVRVFPGDLLVVDGKLVEERQPTRLFRYHKPTGLVTTHNDPGGRPTVFGALPHGLPRVISVGRLDLNSEGLLLLTNDGELSRALEMPQNAWTRRYRARAFGHATQEKLDRLKDGTTIEGVRYGPIEARLDKAKDKADGGRNVWITVTLSEGKNREVRKVLESVGLKVNRLIRLSYGPFALGTLQAGQVEEVGPRVIRELLAGVIADENMPQGDRPQFVGVADPLYAPGVAKDGERLRGGEIQRRAPSGRAPQIATPKAEEPKKVYKAGWAKAKIKVDPNKAKPRRAAKSIETKFVDHAPPRGKPPAPRAGAARGPDGKAGPSKAGAAKMADGKSTGAGKPASARPGKPAGFKAAPRPAGAKPAPRSPKR